MASPASSEKSETNSPAPPKKRSVVSCFIIKYDDKAPDDSTKASVALFRRSDKVSTYQHRLGPIAGSIDKEDASPLAAAWRELREETTLAPRRLELLRQGKSYSFSDVSVGREWTIHPFAFRLRSECDAEAIQTDWEHEGWGWYDPLLVGDAEAFGGVPRLAESLRRVWFEKDLGEMAGAVLARGLKTLANDHQSGARQLAGVALGVLKDVVAQLDDRDPTEEWWAKVRFAAWHIWKNGRESMGAAVMGLLLEALRSVEEMMRQCWEHPRSSHSMKWRDSVVEDMERCIALRAGGNSGSRIVEAFTKYIEERFAARLASKEPITILTLSESSTITLSLHHLTLKSDFKIDLRVLESRPLYEGVSLAASVVEKVLSSEAPLRGWSRVDREGDSVVEGQGGVEIITPVVAAEEDDLESSKLRITIYSDASAAIAAEGVDLVLIGADRISASGAVSNKTGSLPAILSAKHVAEARSGGRHGGGGAAAAAAAGGESSSPVQIVVLSESEKVAPLGEPHEHVVEDNDPNQLLRGWASSYNHDRVRNAAAMLSKVTAGAGGGWEHNGRGWTNAAAGFDGVKLAVKNVFFEWVPAQLIDVYISEFGVWTLRDIAAHSKVLGAEEERLFKDL